MDCVTRFVGAIIVATIGLVGQAGAQEMGGEVLYIYGYIDGHGNRPGDDAYDGDPFHPMRLDNVDPGAPNGVDEARGMSGFKGALEETRFQLTQQHDVDVTLDADTLAKYDVVILGSNNRRFSEAEAAALNRWVHAGGGVVAWSDSAFGGNYKHVGLGNTDGLTSDNDLTRQFGLEFLRDNGAGVFTIREYDADHYLNDYDKDGGVVYRGEGVSLVRVHEPAVKLASLQAGGTGGDVRLHADDGALQANDAALAYAEVGEGRVVATFDRNTFWNGGEGTDITEVDNREYAQRLLRWAAGAE